MASLSVDMSKAGQGALKLPVWCARYVAAMKIVGKAKPTEIDDMLLTFSAARPEVVTQCQLDYGDLIRQVPKEDRKAVEAQISAHVPMMISRSVEIQKAPGARTAGFGSSSRMLTGFDVAVGLGTVWLLWRTLGRLSR